MPGSRKPSHDELQLWQRAMRDVARLDTRAPSPADAAATPQPVGERPRGQAPAPAARPAGPASQRAETAPGLDHRTAERLRRGRMPIAATLDLHGLTQSQAHGALVRFIEQCHSGNRRTVLIITGKGFVAVDEDQRQTGVLRRHVPRWLKEPPLRDKVLAVAPARPQHGGAGAVYVLVRRRRQD